MIYFKDNFSNQSDFYFKYRPSYPPELFRYLSNLSPSHHLACDCGTGNGQSTIGLKEYFTTIYATDPSEKQIRNTLADVQIIYKTETAENSSLPDNSVDIITVAQALHWLSFEKFFTEAKRVLKQNGIIAAWAYGLPVFSTEIDTMIANFRDKVVGDFWQPENRLIELNYSTIPFPFQEFVTPGFKIQKILSLSELLGIIRSWSAVQRYLEQKEINPVDKLKEQLLLVWGGLETKRVATWSLILRVGKNKK